MLLYDFFFFFTSGKEIMFLLLFVCLEPEKTFLKMKIGGK